VSHGVPLMVGPSMGTTPCGKSVPLGGCRHFSASARSASCRRRGGGATAPRCLYWPPAGWVSPEPPCGAVAAFSTVSPTESPGRRPLGDLGGGVRLRGPSRMSRGDPVYTLTTTPATSPSCVRLNRTGQAWRDKAYRVRGGALAADRDPDCQTRNCQEVTGE
jgi:hypothetical protein